MVNGVNVLQEVDARLSDAQREASAAQTEADRLAAQRGRTEEAEALRELARLRLMELADGRQAVDALDAAGAQVREPGAPRSELEAVQRGVLDARDALVAAEARRDAVARHRAAGSRSHRPEGGRCQGGGTPNAACRSWRVSALPSMPAELDSPSATSKGRPYRADPLFAYLWDRGWGTGRYRAFPGPHDR